MLWWYSFLVGTAIGTGYSRKPVTSAKLTAAGILSTRLAMKVIPSTVIRSAGSVLAADALLVSTTALGTTTAGVLAAIPLGYAVGATVGTGIVSVAESKDIVYEGATEDVLDFYLDPLGIPTNLYNALTNPAVGAHLTHSNPAPDRGDHAQRSADWHGMTREEWIANMYAKGPMYD